jgi:hypothetical protein
MGKQTEWVANIYAVAEHWCLHVNLAIAALCLIDYFVQGRDWALLSFAFYVVVINGGLLLVRHVEMKSILKLDLEDARAAFKARHEARMRERGSR